MKNLFKQFLLRYKKRDSYALLTIQFNNFISGYPKRNKKEKKRFLLKAAHVNKFMIRKWCKKLSEEINDKYNLLSLVNEKE